ncbi:MAG: hypothetical protein QOH25_1400 [Acidobacteriota bacterium]|jgi:predicted nucleic acid-binding protein|nr:hypothetical protein [Acidobacteriota bacterium]
MSLYVVDASIAVKLYVPEIRSQQVLRFFTDQHDMIAPDLMLSEFGNIIWKKVNLLGELTRDEGTEIILAAQTLPLYYYETTDLLTEAFQIALDTQCTVYDCLYVALAAAQGCQLITDDRKLSIALQHTSLAALLTLIENY